MAKKLQKTVHHNGKRYIGSKRGGSINVKVSQTAKGQLISAATYDIETKTWNECGRKGCIPTPVREIFETAFGL